MPRTPIDPPTKTCAHCGQEFHRKRTKNGRIQTASNWRAQTACSISCARHLQTARQPTSDRTRTCEACGREYQRKRYPNGRLENSRAWANRRACSVECYGRLRSRENAEARASSGVCINCGKPTTLDARNRPRKTCSPECQIEHRTRAVAEAQAAAATQVEHPPCTACGGPVPKPDHLTVSKWLARKTCGPACSQAKKNTGGRGGHKAYRRTRSERPKPKRERYAPTGYVFDGRFPTPPGVTSWKSVTGPDTGVIATTPNNAVTRSPRTMRMLAQAFGQHPDLGTAFLGALSDSWVQQDAATRTPNR